MFWLSGSNWDIAFSKVSKRTCNFSISKTNESNEVLEVDLAVAIVEEDLQSEVPDLPDDIETPQGKALDEVANTPEIPEIPEQITSTPEIPDIPDQVIDTPEVPVLRRNFKKKCKKWEIILQWWYIIIDSKIWSYNNRCWDTPNQQRWS